MIFYLALVSAEAEIKHLKKVIVDLLSLNPSLLTAEQLELVKAAQLKS